MSRAAVAHAEEAISQHFDITEHYDPAVPLTLLVQSGHNARRRFDAAKLEELASSIREHGIIEPLVIRPFQLGERTKFEIVAGARRYRASLLAGRTHVPCVSRDYSDSQVLELQIIENIQREDLDPLEEAAGYKALIDTNPSHYSAAFIAHRIGRSEKYVWDTMRLLNLIPAAIDHLEEGRITRSHAVVLARLTPERQASIIEIRDGGGLFVRSGPVLNYTPDDDAAPNDGLKAVSVRELEHYIADHVRFDPQHMGTVAPLEFGETVQRIVEAEAKPGRGKKVVAIHHGYHVQSDARHETERTFGHGTWKRADGQEESKPCDHAVLGVVAVGEGYGSVFDVCVAKDKCDVHWKKERKDRERTQELRSKGQTKKADEREAKERQEREAEAARAVADRAAWDDAVPALEAALVAAAKSGSVTRLAELVLDACSDRNRKLVNRVRGVIKGRNPESILRQAFLCILLPEVSRYNAHFHFPKLAKRAGVDVGKILKAQPVKGTK